MDELDRVLLAVEGQKPAQLDPLQAALMRRTGTPFVGPKADVPAPEILRTQRLASTLRSVESALEDRETAKALGARMPAESPGRARIERSLKESAPSMDVVPSHGPLPQYVEAAMRRERQRTGAPMPGLSTSPETARDVRKPAPRPLTPPSMREHLLAPSAVPPSESFWEGVGRTVRGEPQGPSPAQVRDRLYVESDQAREAGNVALADELRRRAAGMQEQHVKPAREKAEGPSFLGELFRSKLVQYPLNALGAATRMVDAWIPGIGSVTRQRRADQSVLDVLPEALAAGAAGADPLGRFTAAGANTGIGTNPPPSFSGVLADEARRYGTPAPGTEVLSPTGEVMYERGPDGKPRPAYTDYEKDGLGTWGTAGKGLAMDLALSPSTYVTFGAGRALGGLKQSGLKFAGRELISAPALETAARATGIPQGLRAAGKAIAGFTPQGGATLGEMAAKVTDRYFPVRKILEDFNRSRVREGLMTREAAIRHQNELLQRPLAKALRGSNQESLGRAVEAIEDPDLFDWGVRQPEPFPVEKAPATARPALPPPAGEVLPTPWRRNDKIPASQVEISGETMGPKVAMPAEGAAPTAVPGTPDAARRGAFPMSGQQMVLTPDEIELAARLENLNRDALRQLEARGLVQPGGRPNFMHRERTAASLEKAKQKPQGTGGGANPRINAIRGFMSRREEVDWLNGVIAEVNDKLAGEAVAKGLMPPAPIPAVRDSTAAVNRFWRSPPEAVRSHLGWENMAEAERFNERYGDVMSKYLTGVVRSVNDYDTMKMLGNLTDEGGGLLRKPFTRVENGVPFEAHETPVGGRYPGPAKTPPAPRGAPRLPATTQAPGERGLSAAPQPARAGIPNEPSFPPRSGEGFDPMDPYLSKKDRPMTDYAVPQNATWARMFPGEAVRKDVASVIEHMGEPYWQKTLLDVFARGAHKAQAPWKLAATSGAGLRFAIRNGISATFNNFKTYGPAALDPKRNAIATVLSLPDEVFSSPKYASYAARSVDVGGRRFTYRELREIAHNSGLWQTTPEGIREISTGAMLEDLTRPMSGYRSTQAKIGRAGRAALPFVNRGIGAAGGAAVGYSQDGERGAVLGALGGAIAGNPFSRDFLPTKYLFGPAAEFTERQARMTAFMLELERGKAPFAAAIDAAKPHVNYQAFSPAMEKYGTLFYPFAKWTVGRMPHEVEALMNAPGRSRFWQKGMETLETTVPPWEREQYESEPKSKMGVENDARLIRLPGMDAPLKEPAVGRAKGPGRLPYVTMSPMSEPMVNVFGAPFRAALSPDPSSQLKMEAFSNAFPAFKMPIEYLTGQNVATGELVNTDGPAPRLVSAMTRKDPKLGAALFGAEEVRPLTRPDKPYVSAPSTVQQLWRMMPNVSAMDLALGMDPDNAKPYDNRTAFLLRLLGLTSVMHDPMVEAQRRAKATADEQSRIKSRAMNLQPP